jgi:beta-glucanase (GH16 family)
MTFVTQNSPVASPVPLGNDIAMQSTVTAVDQASCGKYTVETVVIDKKTNATVQHAYAYNQALDQTAKTFGMTAKGLPAGSYRYGVWIWKPDWSATVSNQQTYSEFEVADVACYAHWKLPLLKKNGDGFLPDIGQSFSLIIGDEFDGKDLDRSQWKTRFIYNNGTLDYLNDELERYIDNHIVTNGQLRFTSHARPGTVGHPPSPSGAQYPLFDSSMIRSITTFKYGYFEARMLLPSGLGVWPAFWINPQSGWPPEIDIIEFVLNGGTEMPTMMHHNVHRSQADGNGRYLYADLNVNQSYAYWRAPSNLDPNYFTCMPHTYSAFWDQDAVTYYIDGEPVAARRCTWKHDDGSDGGMAHLLANLAIGGSWPTSNWTSPVDLNDQVMAIDYVRAFQKSDDIRVGTSPI